MRAEGFTISRQMDRKFENQFIHAIEQIFIRFFFIGLDESALLLKIIVNGTETLIRN